MAPNRYYTSDAVATTLTASLSSVTPGTTGSVQVASITGYPTSYPFTLLPEWGTASQEVVTVTQAATGTGPYTYANCVRGDDGTAAPAHAIGATVVHGVSARDFSDPQTHLGSTTGVHGVSGAMAGLASPTFTGTPAAPTATALTASTQVATTAYADSAVGVETSRAATAEALKGPALTQAAVQTANYTATANQVVPCDISGGSFTVTLPSAPAAGTLFSANIVAVSGVGVNALTLATGGTDVLDKTGGATTGTMTLLHQSVLFEYNSGVWGKVASADPYLQVAANRLGTFYLDQYAGTDDAKMTLAIAAAVTAGGGTIQLSPRAHTFANQWTSTYVSGSSTTALRILGGAVAFNGAWLAPSAATVCTFTYSGAGAACADFQHNGTIELAGIQFKSANVGVPLFQTTNATPNIHDCVFSGGASGVACATDAIVLGGTTNTVGSGDTAKYNAYQGLIYRNFFDGIRRAVLFNVAANSIHVYDNTVSATCGSNLPFGAAFDLIGNATRTVNDVQIASNCIEVVGYPVGIKALYAQQCTFGPNGFYDSNAVHIAPVMLLANANFNRVKSGFHNDTTPFCIDYTGTSSVENLHQSTHSITREPILITGQVASGYLDGAATGLRGYDFNGNYASTAAVMDAANGGGYATISLISGNCTQVSDGILYNGSNWVVSVASATFASTDQWLPINSPQIAATSFIMYTVTPATAWPWGASYAYSLGDVARPPTANSHLYQCTTAGTSGSTAPTWPTSGGTVTDGTAVWTDLGTTATAAFISAPATATASAVIMKWGRSPVTRTLIQVSRFHILSLGSTPTTTADAGAGTSPTGISTVGTDHKFTANITSGTSPATGDMFHTAPAQAWQSTPVFTMAAGNAAAAALMAGGYWLTVSSGTVTANFVVAPTASTAYIFQFIAMG